MSTPAGWYPDPSEPSAVSSGQLRWWDGARWTEHVHQQAAPTPSAGPSLTKAAQYQQFQGHQQDPHQQQNPYQQTRYPRYPPSQYPAPGVKAIATPDGQALGGLGLRLLARIVDWVLITVIATIAGWSSVQTMNRQSAAAAEALAAGNTERFTDLLLQTSQGGAAQTLTFIVLAVSAVYTVLSLRFYGATPGKALCRLRVRGWDRPGHPGWGQSIVRWIGSDFLGQMIPFYLLVDLLWPCWDQRKQALHDKLARTVVVKR